MRRFVDLLLALALTGACSGGAGGEHAAQQIVDDLVEHRYAVAGARYRHQESLVLSAAAATVWRRSLQHDVSAVRELAIDALSRIGAPGDFELLQARLDDPVRGVRQQARDGLVRLDPARASALLRGLLLSASPELVLLAAEGAADLQDVGAVVAICDRLRDAALPEPTRAALALPLARLGDVSAIPVLVDVAVGGAAGAPLRRAAGEAAASLATANDAAAMRMLASADDPYVRDLGLAALDANSAER